MRTAKLARLGSAVLVGLAVTVIGLSIECQLRCCPWKLAKAHPRIADPRSINRAERSGDFLLVWLTKPQ
jgi:hypothetical protein